MVLEADLRRLALALPGSEELDHHGLPSFRVHGRIFATLRPGETKLMVKLSGEDQHNVVSAYPDAIKPVPGYRGRKGSTFVDYSLIDKAFAGTLLELAWRNRAPVALRTVRRSETSS